MNLRIVILVVTSLIPVSTFCQVLDFKWQTVHEYNEDLPKTQIYSILEDGDGFLWLGTTEGLYRSDGMNSIYYSSKEIGFNYCIDLTLDERNYLWVASGPDYSGISRINLTTWEINRFPILDSAHAQSNGVVALDSRDGTVVGITKNYQLFVWQGDEQKHLDLSKEMSHDILNFEVYDVVIDPIQANAVWLSGQNFIAQFNLVDGTRQILIGPNEISANVNQLFYHSAYGPNLFAPVDQNDGIIKIPIRTPDRYEVWQTGSVSGLQVKNGQTNNRFFRMDFCTDSTIWIGSLLSGLGLLNLNKKTIRFEPQPSRFVRAMQSNSKDQIWFSDEDIGLHFGHSFPTIFQEYKLDSTLIGQFCSGLLKKSDDSYLLGFRNTSSIQKWENNQAQAITIDLGEDIYVQDIIREDEDNFLLGTNWGMFRWNMQNNSTNPVIQNYPNPNRRNVNHLVKDRNSSFWAISWGVGVMHLQKDDVIHWITAGESSNQLPHSWIHELFLDSKSDLWIGTENGIVYLDIETYDVHHLPDDIKEQFPNANIKAITEDQFGRFWLSHFGLGISCYDPSSGQYTRMTTAHGLQSDRVYDMMHDDSGRIWLWCSQGLSVLFPEGNVEQSTIKYFPETRYFDVGKNATWLRTDESGMILFPVRGGFVASNPDEMIASDRLPRQPTIQSVTTTRQKHLVNSSDIELEHDENFFQVQFTSPSFTEPDDLEFSYFLEGLDPSWVVVTDRREAIYTKVPAGEYQFHVKSRVRYGNWTSPVSIRIHLTPVWYLTMFAKTIWVLIPILILASIFLLSLARQRLKNRLSIERLESQNLKELDQTKSNFFTQISHEFRTPLTVILGMSDLLSVKQDTQFIEKAKSSIQRNGKFLLGHINQILDLTKLRSKHIELDYRHGNIVPFIKYLVEAYQGYAVNQGIDLTLSAPNVIAMDYDADRIQDVISNLLSNALKFTSAGDSIVIKLAKAQIESEDFFHLLIRDSGIGMDTEQQKRIFEPYYQIVNAHSRNGSGLGLAICKNWVEAMGGTIQVESVLGKGTSFFVMLPVMHSSSMEHSESFKTDIHVPIQEIEFPQSVSDSDGEKPVVLLVDDDPDVLYYLQLCIEDKFGIEIAKNGKEGLESARHGIPDLIVSDVMMSEMDGYELLVQLRSDELTNHIPVILLTARTTQEEKRMGLSLGADAYLTKPFDQKELLIRIQGLLDRNQTLKEHFSKSGFRLDQLQERPQDEFLDKIEEYVFQNLSVGFSIEDLSKHLGVSRIQLYRKVKGITGKSPSNYVRLIRLLEARKRIFYSQDNISEIAYSVGFKDPAYFSRVFQQEFDVSPSKYRQQM